MTYFNRILAAVVAALIPAVGWGQLPNAGPPVDPNAQFEAASVKGVDGNAVGARLMMQPGRLVASGVPLRLLLRQALRVQDYQIIGAPDWVDTERYEINAKMPDGSPQNAMPVMLLNLMKERFKLVTRTESRELPMYALVVARSDGRLGPALKPSPSECREMIAARGAGPRAGGPGGPGGPASGAPADGPRAGGPGFGGPGPGAAPRAGGPPPPPDFNQPAPCGMMRMGPGLAGGGGQPIAQLVTMLSQLTGRPVVDRTGLEGVYDFDLKYAAESAQAFNPFGGPPPGATPVAADPDAPGLSTAIQEQLGLKLESTRGPVEVTLIERLDRPTLD